MAVNTNVGKSDKCERAAGNGVHWLSMCSVKLWLSMVSWVHFWWRFQGILMTVLERSCACFLVCVLLEVVGCNLENKLGSQVGADVGAEKIDLFEI